jgi:F-type H+-transporting ATPase subunit b
MNHHRQTLTLGLTVLLSLTAPAFAAGGGEVGWSKTIFHGVNAAILFYIIYRFFGPKVTAGLQSKSKQVARDIDEATRLHAEASARLAAAEADLAALAGKAEALLADLRREGEAERDKLVAQAKAEAERITAEAERTARSEIARVKARLEAELGEMAVEAAARALREKTTPADQRRLAVEYLTRLEERS